MAREGGGQQEKEKTGECTQICFLCSSPLQCCIIPETFRQALEGGSTSHRVPLTEEDIARIVIRVVDHGLDTGYVAGQFEIGQRRVQQLAKVYRETGVIPPVGRRGRRPYAQHPPDLEERVLRVYRRTRRGAAAIARYFRVREGIHVGNGVVHGILKGAGLVRENPNMRKRKKPWIRYEREHSLSAGHMDWHYNSEQKKWVCAVLDDASRMVLAGGEYDQRSSEAAVEQLIEVLQKYRHIQPLREVITDHGSEFYANTRNEDGTANHAFESFCRENGINHILCQYKHPQSNGKLEKWFDTYERYRKEFATFDDFVQWYNRVRPHSSLDEDRLETPEMAFYRKCQDILVRNYMRMVERELGGTA